MHCLERIDLAQSIPSYRVISKGESQFEVHSQTAMLDGGKKFPLVDMMQYHHVHVKSGNALAFHANTCLQYSDIGVTGVLTI